MSIVLDGTSGIIVSGNTNTFSGVGVGLGAGAVSTNTALGYQAGFSNTSGDYLTVVGYQAGYGNTTGRFNTAIGRNALFTNSTSNDNTALGYSTLALTTATGNTAVGSNCLGVSTTGASNTGVGNGALTRHTTGSNNVAVGVDALSFSTTGATNTAVGYQAGYAIVTGAGNVFLGNQTGYATTASNNTFLGNSAGYAVTSGAKNTIIGQYNGNQGGLDIRTSSNNIVLSDGDGNIRYYASTSGSMVFNGVAIPSSSVGGSAFQVAGDARMQLIQATTSTGTRALQEFYNPNGNVGSIGTSGSNAYYATTSDYRLKENITPMTGALAKIAQLKPVNYKWKVSNLDGQGFIAHELAEIVPDCVHGIKDAVDANGNPVYQVVDTSFLVATLTAAIQELKAEFDAYKLTHP